MRIGFSLSVKDLERILEEAKKNILSGVGDSNITFDVCDNAVSVQQKDIKHEGIDSFFTDFGLHTEYSQQDYFSDIKSEYGIIKEALETENKALRDVAKKVIDAVCPSAYCHSRDLFNGYNIRGIGEEDQVITFESEGSMFEAADMSDCYKVRVEYQDKILGAWKPVSFKTDKINPEITFIVPCTAYTSEGEVIAFGTFTDH